MSKPLGLALAAALISAAAVAAIVLAFPSGTRAEGVLQSCPGAFPPKRPELANVKASGMACWAAKLLLDEAMEQRVGSKKTINLLGFTCRYKPETEASGTISCTGHGATARGAFSVF
jgi:hypothetical protein